MNVSMTMQEILATIQRNQEQIDLLTANNTELSNYLMEHGMAQNMASLVADRGAHVALPARAQVNSHLLALPAPAAPPAPRGAKKRRGRPRKALVSRSDMEWGRGQAELLISWACENEGILELSAFREASEGMPGVSPSFFKTTMYAKAGKLVDEGLLRRKSPGVYRLMARG